LKNPEILVVISNNDQDSAAPQHKIDYPNSWKTISRLLCFSGSTLLIL